MDLPENLRPKQPGWRKKGVMKKGESSRDKDGKNGNQSVESHTPPGLPHGLTFVNEVASTEPTTLPTREDRASTFSYDAMAANDHTPLATTTTTTTTTYERQHSPMFASASAHDFARSMARSPSPTNVGVSTSGIDPQLDGLFGNPAASSIEKDNPVHVVPDDDTLSDTAGEALDIFNMTHDDERDEDPMFPGTGSDTGENAFERSDMFGDEWLVNEDDFCVDQ
jgi:hypothetical protein